MDGYVWLHLKRVHERVQRIFAIKPMGIGWYKSTTYDVSAPIDSYMERR